ncbi:RagB/SusD family nutrient uptake outer membrane protein [Zunongwangia sp. F363]|uniref:RagB/SusD family nutrient uptake outer membrane protein n=1 Tax=Autumnicola tepida TaxID=3075595 RepID=A0ABU3CA88_9FLAO|nr:RagB/SusD family nutrient uptake outer membrane protein [Zunongwangia sp. F363]MDT0643249.1 RagB/SusD family nutrient uptake outer membrane protein [Zunongwangia sp. F363]
MKNKFIKTAFLLGAVLNFTACTDLELEETDSIFREDSGGGFSGVSDVPSALANNYNAIRDQLNTQENLYALQEVTTDEMLVPTRGTDWGDNGLWRSLHQHTWDPNHQFLLNSWNNNNRNVFNLSEIIAPESNANPQQIAEAKFLRAFSMFWVMDLFGQVPFRGVDEGADVDPGVMTRSEAFDFIMTDLTDALPDLRSAGPGAEANFATKAAAHYLLAKLYLNKHIYLSNAQTAPEDMNMVIEHVDEIAALGFGLQSGFFELFKPAVDSETIWYTNTGVGSRIWNGLHYNQGVPGQEAGGWNGFATLAEFYDLFEGPEDSNHPDVGQEERRGFVPVEGTRVGEGDGYFAGGKDDDGDGFVDGSYIGLGFLFGQQYNLDGSMTETRSGAPLFYTKELPGLVGNPENSGIRVLKYHPSNGAYAEHMILFRYADAHLMKAEAIMRGGSSSETALELVNELRELRMASPLTNLAEQDMLDERGRELYNEMWRRQDLIRFGQFTEEWAYKPESGEFRTLFPIPTTALTSNPNLTQNEGY